MAIAVRCAGCSAAFEVADEMAGKRGLCPQCRQVLTVPKARSASAPPRVPAPPVSRPAPPVAVPPSAVPLAPAGANPAVARNPAARPVPAARPAARAVPTAAGEPIAQRAAAVLGAFQGTIDPIRVSLTYRAGIALVSLVMVMLPLIYLAIIGLTMYAVYWHATHNIGMLVFVSGQGALVMLVAYLAPIVVGGLVVLFMVKPLFARAADDRSPVTLSREQEPLVFAFVDRICAAVGAPVPNEIAIDSQVNASASFRRGLLSFFDDDLRLTIGMPLVAGMTLRQFGGVLAHEFGHFGQGAALRLTYVVRAINLWFLRVVYQRDVWDEWLVRTARQSDLRIGFVLHIAKFLIWVSRRVLWLLMVVGHAVSGFMMRQMEFDADRYEARLAGSDTFESTVHRLAELSLAQHIAQQQLEHFFREGRLADDLPRLTVHNVNDFDAEIRSKLREQVEKSETGWFDTHPADSDRVHSARAEQAPGIFRLDRPAADLFVQFLGWCRFTTIETYRGVFGAEFQESMLCPVERMLRRQDQDKKGHEALQRYFQGTFSLLRPIVAAPGATAPRALLDGLKAARQRMIDLAPAYRHSYKQFDEADTRQIDALRGQTLHRCRLPAAASQLSLPSRNEQEAQWFFDHAIAVQQRLTPELQLFEQAAGQRLGCALALLRVPQVAARLTNVERLIADSDRMLAVFATLSGLTPKVLMMRNTQIVLATACEHLSDQEENQALFRTIKEMLDSLVRQILEANSAMMSVMYPFDHAQGPISVAAYALNRLPDPDDLGAVFHAATSFVDQLGALYHRVAGSLAETAEVVEAAAGLPRLAPPPEPESEAAETAPLSR